MYWRIFIGESEDPSHDEEVWLLEVDLDDMDMEYLGVVAERIRPEVLSMFSISCLYEKRQNRCASLHHSPSGGFADIDRLCVG